MIEPEYDFDEFWVMVAVIAYAGCILGSLFTGWLV